MSIIIVVSALIIKSTENWLGLQGSVELKQTVEFLIKRKQLKDTSKRTPKTISYIASFRFILPQRYREEFAGDITEIYDTLREEGHSKFWIYFILSLNLSTVIWASIRFKYSEYFEKARSVRKSE